MGEDDIPRVKVFHITEESLKELGELLSQKTSRDIIRVLIEQEMYVNEISNKLDLRVSLVIHHLEKIKKLGLLDITSKPINKRTKDHMFYKFNKNIFIDTEIPQTENRLSKIFHPAVRFAAIGIITASVFMITDFLRVVNPSDITSHTIIPILSLPLITLIISLVSERILFRKKK